MAWISLVLSNVYCSLENNLVKWKEWALAFHIWWWGRKSWPQQKTTPTTPLHRCIVADRPTNGHTHSHAFTNSCPCVHFQCHFIMTLNHKNCLPFVDHQKKQTSSQFLRCIYSAFFSFPCSLYRHFYSMGELSPSKQQQINAIEFDVCYVSKSHKYVQPLSAASLYFYTFFFCFLSSFSLSMLRLLSLENTA